jgi:hypothetical protein
MNAVKEPMVIPKTFHRFLSEPLTMRSRVLLAIAVIPLVMAFKCPLWRISMEAPQYPRGLWMEIYAHSVTGGDDGQHLQEINTLNHYIGMKPIDRAALSDLDWLPFALGALVLLTLRVAAIGTVGGLVDLVVLTTYVGGFGLARFYYKLYVFGHALDPRAPVKVEPFTPVMLGTKQIGNFTTHAMPQAATFLIGAFATVCLGVLVVRLVSGYRAVRTAS